MGVLRTIANVMAGCVVSQHSCATYRHTSLSSPKSTRQLLTASPLEAVTSSSSKGSPGGFSVASARKIHIEGTMLKV